VTLSRCLSGELFGWEYSILCTLEHIRIAVSARVTKELLYPVYTFAAS
jgi:hypothetical protein